MQTLKKASLPESTPDTSSPRILIAEDNQINQKLMQLLFTKLNIDVKVVCNGHEAVQEAISGGYELILMDIHMPEMNGLDACKAIKTKMGNKAPAVVALSADYNSADRPRYIKYGLDHFLTKPLNIEDVKLVLREYTFIQDMS